MPDTDARTSEKSIVKKRKPQNRMVVGLRHFFIETKAEFRKIIWPTRKQTATQTMVVLLAILLVGALIWGLDTLTTQALGAILKKY